MKKPKKDKNFIKLPKYLGGSATFKKFITDNLRYPKEALENKIEGVVHLKYDVNYLGEVIRAKVIKGLGYGCDEESLRLVKMLKYEKSKNRGLRVTAKMKTKINFKLKKQPVKIKYKYIPKAQEIKESTKSGIYNYTIGMKLKIINS